MVTYRELTDLRLGKLHTAITAWEQTVDRLNKVANGGGDGVSAHDLERKAQGADWRGQNATVTKEFVTRSAGEFDDVLTSARSVHSILSSAHAQFTKHKETAETIRQEAAPKNILVNDNGTVTDATPSPQVEGPDGKVNRPTQKEIDAVADRVRRLLWEAGETDRIAARALRTLAKDPYDFSGASYDDLADADRKQGAEDADAMLKLAAEKDGLSQEELRHFNQVLKNQRDNPAFAERFATGMGGDGTLQFWRSLADPGQDRTPRGERAELLGRFQNNLSMTLATASHGDSPAMEKWKQDVIAAGPKEFGHPPTRVSPYGFQIMSNLMGQGTFDQGFLRDYGHGLMAFEQDRTKGPFDPAALWANPAKGVADLDHTGGADDNGTDPMTGFLTAASHNPGYATELFNDDSTAHYLLSEREFYDEADPLDNRGNAGEGPMESREALGKALLAGGSGMNPDDPGATYAEHTDAHRHVLDNALADLSAQKNDFPPELRDDMANLLGNHGDAAHQSMSAPLGDGPLNRDQLLEVSKQISRNKDSYALLNEQMNAAMIHDIHTETHHPEDSLDRSGRTVGFLEEARYQAINDKKDGELLDASWKRGWVNSTVGTGLGYIPHAGSAVTAGVSLAMQGVYEDEVARAGAEANTASKDTSDLREGQLRALGDEWYSRNSDWAENTVHDGYSKHHGLYSHIGASANDGKQDAREDAGDQ